MAKLTCEIPKDDQPDRAQAVIRFERDTRAGDGWQHGTHSITIGGIQHHFWELDTTGKGFEAQTWQRGGLCRITVFHGRLFVLFPYIGNPQTQMAQARELRIVYSVGGKHKSLLVQDPGQIATLASKFSVRSTTTILMRNSYQGGTVQLFMPDNAVIGFAFISPAGLAGGDWARIELRSTDFYDRLCDLVSQAEGKRIMLPTLK